MKNIVLKVLFILSFIPYLLLIYSILFGKYFINGIEIQGMERILNNLSYAFSPNSFSIFSPIIVACFTYQMCYISRKNFKRMFICSFIPCVFIILMGLHGALFGARFFGDTLSYGLDGLYFGVLVGIIYYTSYLLIPVCIVFQIICLIINRMKKETNKS